MGAVHVSVNLAGYPAASICAGLDGDRMPVGLQIVGRAHAECDVIRAAAAFERTSLPRYDLRVI